MTNISRSFALNCAAAVTLATVLAGCGPKDGLKDLARAREAYSLHDLPKAERFVVRSLADAPANVDALILETRILVDLGEIARARESINRALEISANDADVRMLDAQVAWHATDYARAEKVFGELAKDSTLDAGWRADAFVGLGMVQMATNGIDFARISFLSALRLERKNVAAWYHLGFLYRNLNYLEAALEQFQCYVRVADPSERVLKIQRSVIPELRDAIAAAAVERTGAASRNSAASSAAILRAQASEKRGQYKTAKEAYAEAFKLDPLSYPAALGVAECALKLGQTQVLRAEAFRYYREACALAPSRVKTHLIAGDLAMKNGQVQTAVSIYSRALAADPTNLTVIDGLIRSLRKAGGNENVRIAAAYQGYRDLLSHKR